MTSLPPSPTRIEDRNAADGAGSVPPAGSLSPDGWWLWDGHVWSPAWSPDGKWRWTRAGWVRVRPERAAPRPALLVALVCAIGALLILAIGIGIVSTRTGAPAAATTQSPLGSPAPGASPSASAAPTGDATPMAFPDAPAGTVVINPWPVASHATGTLQYPQSPPAGGAHSPTWLNCGVYTNPVVNENAVHSLEHGVVWVTYDTSLAAADVDALRTAVRAEYSGTERLLIVSPYPGLGSAVVASAWGVQLRLDSVHDARLRSFIQYFRDGPQTPEHGGRCTGGVGTPSDSSGSSA